MYGLIYAYAIRDQASEETKRTILNQARSGLVKKYLERGMVSELSKVQWFW